MAQHHNYSITEIENMVPYELDLYVTLLLKYLNEKQKSQQTQNENNSF